MTDKFLYFFLCLIEPWYRVVFYGVQWRRRSRGPRPFSCPVIVVGNLTVGGTGKTIMTSLIADLVRDYQPCVISTGHGGIMAQRGFSAIIGDGQHSFFDALYAGDEPFVLASAHALPVVVGRSRYRSYQLAAQVLGHRVGVYIFDDAYQAVDIVPDLSIVLVCGRRGLGNGHVLPAGPAREHDFSRADIIIVVDGKTDDVVVPLAPQQTMLRARRSFQGFYRNNRDNVHVQEVENMPVVIVAGIGNFQQFFDMVLLYCNQVVGSFDYNDHHRYSSADIDFLQKYACDRGIRTIITTEKDWVKIGVCEQFSQENGIDWLVARVGFEFLTDEEYSTFRKRVVKVCSLR